jgi:thiamine biosynthesis lipoprotein
MISAVKMNALSTLGQHLLLAFLLVSLNACSRAPQPVVLEGASMGTRYHITLTQALPDLTTQEVNAGVSEVLEAVENSMSTWREESEISRFNRTPAGVWLGVSPGFMEVFLLAREVAGGSEGAYDVSVAPLVKLWGFGPGGTDAIPAQSAIDRAMEAVGEHYVEVDLQGSKLRKQRPLTLDFSSIAKGYAVDQLASWLAQEGGENFMVEVGGEIRVRGRSPRGSHWRIAIERPQPLARDAAAILQISDRAVATSGDYRNFFEVDGVRYSHSIDPRSGRPVRHGLVSVTVVHDTTALADAWATALTVLGRDRALEIALREDLAVYLISRDGSAHDSTELRVDKTPAIEPFLQ